MNPPAPLWPRRWLTARLLPLFAVMAAAFAIAAGGWRVLTGTLAGAAAASIAALILLITYGAQLRGLTALEWGELPEARGVDAGDTAAVRALRRRALLADLRRYTPSVLLRAILLGVIARLIGTSFSTAIALGLAASLAIGLVRLVRQRAILETYSTEP
jgi:hypothetical protein